MKGGVGTASARAGAVIVGMLVVVNAVGDVRDASGAIIAGARGPDGAFVDARRYLAQGGAPFGAAPNTTLAVVATNAAVDKIGLESVAQAVNDALSRCITPFGTAFDGDITFALSTAATAPASPLQVEALASLAVPEAVERAVRSARGIQGVVPGLADRR
jgi:L-aminopeptidase/D-esterase-like protein